MFNLKTFIFIDLTKYCQLNIFSHNNFFLNDMIFNLSIFITYNYIADYTKNLFKKTVV